MALVKSLLAPLLVTDASPRSLEVVDSSHYGLNKGLIIGGDTLVPFSGLLVGPVCILTLCGVLTRAELEHSPHDVPTILSESRNSKRMISDGCLAMTLEF